MSGLKEQLQGIRNHYRSLHDSIERKSRIPYGPKALVPSILFTGLEAADQSQAFLHELVMDALESLGQKNEWWRHVYQERDSFLLFNSELNRSLLSKHENVRLNKEIRVILLGLSPFMMSDKGEAWKLLEWMIRKGRIHECNKMTLLSSVFPFHETILFKRIVMILPVGAIVSERSESEHDTHALWDWLAEYQKVIVEQVNHPSSSQDTLSIEEHLKSLVTLYRETIVQKLDEAKLFGLVEELEKWILQYMEQDLLFQCDTEDDSINGLLPFVSFWTVLFFESLDKKRKSLPTGESVRTRKYKRHPHLWRQEQEKIWNDILQNTILKYFSLILDSSQNSNDNSQPLKYLSELKTEWKYAQLTLLVFLIKIKMEREPLLNATETFQGKAIRILKTWIQPLNYKFHEQLMHDFSDLLNNIQVDHSTMTLDPDTLDDSQMKHPGSDTSVIPMEIEPSIKEDPLIWNYLDGLPRHFPSFAPLFQRFIALLSGQDPSSKDTSSSRRQKKGKNGIVVPESESWLSKLGITEFPLFLDYFEERLNVASIDNHVHLLPLLVDTLDVLRSTMILKQVPNLQNHETAHSQEASLSKIDSIPLDIIALEQCFQRILTMVYDLVSSMQHEDIFLENSDTVLRLSLWIHFLRDALSGQWLLSLKSSFMIMQVLTCLLPLTLDIPETGNSPQSRNGDASLDENVVKSKIENWIHEWMERVMPVFLFMSHSISSSSSLMDSTWHQAILDKLIGTMLPLLLHPFSTEKLISTSENLSDLPKQSRFDFVKDALKVIWHTFFVTFERIPISRRASLFQCLLSHSLSVLQQDEANLLLAHFIHHWCLAFPIDHSETEMQQFIIESLLLPMLNSGKIRVLCIIDSFTILLTDIQNLFRVVLYPQEGASFSIYHIEEFHSEIDSAVNDLLFSNYINHLVDIFKQLFTRFPALKKHLRVKYRQSLITERMIPVAVQLKELSILQEKSLISKKKQKSKSTTMPSHGWSLSSKKFEGLLKFLSDNIL